MLNINLNSTQRNQVMRKIWVIFLLVAVIVIFPVIVTAAFTFSHSLRISESTMLLLLGFLLMALGGRGLKRTKP